MGSYNRQFTDGSLGNRKKLNNWRARAYQYEPGNANYPIMGANAFDLATGVTGAIGRVCFPGGDVMLHYKGAGQTLFGPIVSPSKGKLALALDQTTTEGVEYIFNSNQFTAAVGRQTRITGTSGASFGRVSLEIEDVSGLTECAFGLRKVETAQANIDDYADMAVLNVQAGVVNRETIVGGAATVTVNTGYTWVDGATHEISYYLGRAQAGGARVCELLFDGRGAGSFTFTNALSVQPFLFLLQGADLSLVWPGSYFFELGYVRDVERGV